MVKFATIGSNFVLDFFMDGISQVENVKVVAAYSRTEENARKVAKKYQIPRIFTSLEEVAKDDEVNAVYIASPNSCHFEQTLMMLNAGKHVFLEKPAVTSAQEFKILRKAAKDNNIVLMEAMRPVHGPAIEKIRSLLPKLGKVRRVHIYGGKYSSRYNDFREGVIQNAFDPTLQNSALMDMGVYAVEFMAALFGKPTNISARAINLHNGFEAMGSAICVYDGMLADISYGKISDSYIPCEIQGEDGSLTFDYAGEPQTVTLYTRGEKEPEVFQNVFGDHPMQYEVKDFISACEGKLSDFEKYNDLTEMTIEIMDEMRRQTGCRF